MTRADRFLRWFAALNGSKRLFYTTVTLFACYVIWGERIPGLPHLATFDPYPYVFMTFALSLWANLQNIALQFTGQGIDETADRIRYEQRRLLEKIEAEESEALLELRALLAQVQRLVTRLETPE